MTGIITYLGPNFHSFAMKNGLEGTVESFLKVINNEINYIKNELNDNYFLEFLDKIKTNGKIHFLNKSLIDELIDNIYVYEDGSVKISFKYKNEFNDAIKFFKSHNCMI